jgi:plastocyanin
MRRRLVVSMVTLPLLLVLGLALAGGATAGGGCHEQGETASTGSSSMVRITGCTFGPTINQVPVGVAVTFLNTSPIPHDVTGRSFAWGSGTLENGGSYSYQFTTAGIYPYSCSLHPGMAGVVVVGSVAAVADTTDIAPVAASAPIEPAAPAEPPSPLSWLAVGALGLLVGLATGAAIMSRMGRPA